jgi:hypothetical protein
MPKAQPQYSKWTPIVVEAQSASARTILTKPAEGLKPPLRRLFGLGELDYAAFVPIPAKPAKLSVPVKS